MNGRVDWRRGEKRWLLTRVSTVSAKRRWLFYRPAVVSFLSLETFTLSSRFPNDLDALFVNAVYINPRCSIPRHIHIYSFGIFCICVCVRNACCVFGVLRFWPYDPENSTKNKFDVMAWSPGEFVGLFVATIIQKKLNVLPRELCVSEYIHFLN